ncbi:type II toxin-antitoxin system death-on-curing family toxin [Virgibacillus siamensis]|uniref:type II toxin-antitoxin system death-on-curing family toxin n=1 Tax=Virgibacillus siamensis TaxID=480071 RepID=UPI00098672F4|nr:type II toxin-antitoxin system death-on-curing family toxin [Virgibacillus siamensis]
MEITYLNTKDVVLIHFMIMKKYGKGEHSGIKDQGLLESAVHRSQQPAFGEDAYPVLLEKAAAFFESLARNHCLYNGNKRTAFASVDVFLKKNGYKIKRNDQLNEDFTVIVAKGEASLSDIKGWLEENTEAF